MWEEKGFANQDDDVVYALREISSLLPQLINKLNSWSEDDLCYKASPNKWSKKEIIGHLIDSALNNLKRFTDIQFTPQPYIIIAYQQNELVQVNNYQQLSIHHLLALWQSLNLQIIEVIKIMPKTALQLQVKPQYEQTGVQTLAWLVCDYVAHLKHHLKDL